MVSCNDYWNHRQNGSVKTELIPRSDWTATKADHLIEAKCKIRWEPPYQVACQLPEGFALEFECWVGKDGVRRFRPVKPLPAFNLEASLAGHALLVDRDEDHDKEKKSALSHHEARLFNQFSRHTREYLGETLEIGNLLYVSKAGRLEPGTQDILPDDIGTSGDGSGERWDMIQFKDIGIEAAQAAGIANPTRNEVTWFGLLEGARLNPLRISDLETEELVRLAFYTFGPEGAKLGEAVVAYVAEQVRASLKDHLDDSTEKFDNKWIVDSGSNLISRIAKREDCPGEKEDKNKNVRRAMLELGWRSFKQLAQCIDACMRAVAAALPELLTKEEEELFARMYFSHQAFGRIPLILLQERFAVLKRPILEIWANPRSRKAVAVLCQVIWYYSEIVANRRAGDRQLKRRPPQRNEDGQLAKVLSLNVMEEENQSAIDTDSMLLLAAMDIGGRDELDLQENSSNPTVDDEFAMRVVRAETTPTLDPAA